MRVADLDAMDDEGLRGMLTSCCGSSRWVEEMLSRRPFRNNAGILHAAREAWDATGPADWLEAFSHHPRIGERKSAAGDDPRASTWSATEQSATASAARTVQEELAEVNRAYEQRFGFIYIVCASGRTAEELLSIARTRLDNDRPTELRIAAGEQQRITELRIGKLIGDEA